MRDDHRRLRDIEEAIERVERYAAKGKESFEQDELIQTWIVHYLVILGEAATKLSEPLKTRHPEVPWKKIQGMRNILVHNYFEIDLDIVWQVVLQDIPDLKLKLINLLREERASS